ncbi:LysR family transcriptional regulator [Streptomyces sp. NPDC052396]|uniref:LysR family transcriptional regulator n=1 Tax=Streptomyces sp. NPDC052396 TaxID=3365689 RepID=UPI0037D8D3E8
MTTTTPAPATADPTPAELRVIVAVAQEGSFSAAGKRLGLTQSAVSHCIRTVERKVGAVLFDRGRHGARPTPAGERVAAHARGVLRLLEVMRTDAVAAASGTLSTTLRIATFRSAAAALLPAALSRLAARHPQVVPRVAVVREIGPGAAGEVVAGRADLAIASLPHRIPDAAGLVSVTLFEEPHVLIHPAGSRDPRRLPLVNWDENCSSRTRGWFAGQNWIPATTIDVADDSVVLSMVAHGMGMAIVPRMIAAEAPPSVAVMDLGADPPTRTVGFVTTHELARSTAVRELIRELRGERGRLGP